jgi:hypothetical protein
MAHVMAVWLVLAFGNAASAHVTTTGLVRIELTGDRLTYALSVALPEIPPSSVSLLNAAANRDRSAAETVAQAARRSVVEGQSVG